MDCGCAPTKLANRIYRYERSANRASVGEPKKQLDFLSARTVAVASRIFFFYKNYCFENNVSLIFPRAFSSPANPLRRENFDTKVNKNLRITELIKADAGLAARSGLCAWLEISRSNVTTSSSNQPFATLDEFETFRIEYIVSPKVLIEFPLPGRRPALARSDSPRVSGWRPSGRSANTAAKWNSKTNQSGH